MIFIQGNMRCLVHVVWFI